MIIKGNIWDYYNQYDAICCTCNAVVKKNCELVMGAGIALEFNKKFNGLAKDWGESLLNLEKRHGCKPLIMIKNPRTIFKIDKTKQYKNDKHPYLVYFKTKEHWQDQSYISLIIRSMEELCDYIDLLDWEKVLLPAPGCTNGGLDWETQIYPEIKYYLDNYKEIDIIMKD
jgi:hypothetical protein